MIEVVTGALVRNGRVLLVHRGPDRLVHPGVWDLPGGHVEPGEPEAVALARELYEELGVRIGPATCLCRLRVGEDGAVRFSAWLVTEWAGSPVNAAPEEHDEIRWFRPGELPPLVHEPVRAAVVKACGG